MPKVATSKTLTREDLATHIGVRINDRPIRELRGIVSVMIENLSNALQANKSIYLGKHGKLRTYTKQARPDSVFGPIPERMAVTLSSLAPTEGGKYLKSDFIAEIQTTAGLTSREARDVYKAFEGFLDLALEQKYRIELRGFGSFYPRYYAARMRHNPKTGVKIPMPETYTLAFKLAKKQRYAIEHAVGM